MKNQLRIIGGKWRGRKLNFVDAQGLRPTLDRVRETLFNWLQPIIYNAHCLDLYSGSGALAFEALSRGASQVTMVDNNRQVSRQLNHNLELLSCENATVKCMDAVDFLSQQPLPQSTQEKYQVVFLDPPFNQGLLDSCCEKIEQQQLLADNSYIYIEAEKNLQLNNIPDAWFKLKEKKAGQLAYYLFYRE
ncbi:MAG: 16S rRNA (guanine(966)-N(2))-methyltransferase RsmD [Pseudomonadota bacterium]